MYISYLGTAMSVYSWVTVTCFSEANIVSAELLLAVVAVSQQAQGWTLETIMSTPDKRFIKSHANLKQLPVGTAKGLKVTHARLACVRVR